NGPVFTAAVKKAVRAVPAGALRHLVVDMEAVTDVDVTGAEAFHALKVWLVAHDVELSFSRMRPQARERLVALGLLDDEQVFATNRAATAALADTAS
ncbi:sodium-independent anion transporter, partial [Rhizobium johnstonii]|uniref:sodium-independent anion transporter n=1 Tax=Rhizobium johnstonii TaxID=3019933 RepID=UPI003F975F60